MKRDDLDTPSASSTMANEDLGPFLHHMVQAGASDLFLSVGAVPTVKIDGRMTPLGQQALRPGTVKRFAYSVMSEAHRRDFEKNLECDLAVPVSGLGRFRLNVFVQRGEVSLVARHVKSRIPGFEELRLPRAVEQLALLRQGLVLLVGAAGSGKSTTLASMLDFRNRNMAGHVVTVEDPIEFVHAHNRCIIDQREVGLDTHTFQDALRHVLRQSPDVIMIGEIRDAETMRHVLHYAETGHLVLSTLHANNANQAIDRIISFFPESAHRQVRMDLSLNLRGVLAQRLVDGKSGSRVLASELMLWSAYISELIQKGDVDEIKGAIAKSGTVGMQTFDQSLYDLYQQGLVTLDQALEHADSRTDLSLRIRLGAGLKAAPGDLGGMGLEN